MRFLKKTAMVLVVLVALLAICAYLLPRQVHVERSTVIDAPRATVFSGVTRCIELGSNSMWPT